VSVSDGRDRGAGPAVEYDRFVDWEARLAREAPLFRRVFTEVGAHTVLDVGCGTGQHALMFAGWGLAVTGVDPDPSMLAQAAANADAAAETVAAAGGSVRFVEGGFGELEELGLGPADALTCTGNALPHVAGLAGLSVALSDFAAVLRPGGVVVLHLLNHDRLLSKRIRAIAPVVRDAEDGTWVFLRVIDYADEGIRLDFVTLQRPGGWTGASEWRTLSSHRALHTPLPSSVLEGALEAAGFDEVVLLGDHAGRQLDPGADESVIVVARRRSGRRSARASADGPPE
jgi:glycine/sarcosine N-methyltransferase